MEVIDARPTDTAKAISLIWHPHPVSPSQDRDVWSFDWEPGKSVREIVTAAGVDPHQPIAITLDDRLLTVQEWDLIAPRAGQIINVQATVMGGGGGGDSNPVQVVLTIALVVAAPYAAGYLNTAMGLGFAAQSVGMAALTAGVMMAGSLLIGTMFSPSMPSGGYQNQEPGSPTYSLTGASNSVRLYEPMPVVFGTHRIFPDLGSRPYTQYVGDDQYLYQIFNLGLSDLSLTDWKIGTTPITSYSDYTWHQPDSQGKISDFPGNVDTGSGAVLTAADGWISRSTSAQTFKIGLDLIATLYYANDQGGLDTRSVNIEVQIAVSGTGVWTSPSGMTVSGNGASVSGNVITLSGNKQTPRRATIFITPASVGQYDIRLRRTTADSTNSREQTGTSWDSIKSYQLDTASYTGQKRIGISIRASEQLNGSLQQLSVMASASANYWNGSAWVYGKTSNPAHWFMDFAKGRKDSNNRLLYGLNLSDAQIDLAALHAWAQFCNEEKLSINMVLDGQRTASDVLSVIARCGFGSPTWASGKLGVVWDARNTAPVAMFGMANILRGVFSVSYVTEQLSEEIVVRFINPDKDWVQDEVRVTVPGVTEPQLVSTVEFMGCTNQAMAGKYANYLAAQQYYRKRLITWETDFEGFVCQRGDVVLLSHDLTQWGYSGRIRAVSGDSLQLDRKVPRSGNEDYVMVRRPDGAMSTYTVTADSGDSDTLVLTSTPALQGGVDVIDHVWAFSPTPTPGKRVKIVSVTPVSELRLRIVATDEDPQFYSAWDGSFRAPAVSTLLLNSTPEISNVRITETLAKRQTGIVSTITVAFSVKGSFERASYRWRINNGDWTKGSTTTSQFEFDSTEIGALSVEIFPFSGLNQGQVAKATAQVLGISAPPGDVELFSVDSGASVFTLTWKAVPDIDVVGYQIRWINGNSRDWGQAYPIHEGYVSSSPYVSAVRPTGLGTLMIKAIDQLGKESVNAAAIVVDLGDAITANVLEIIDFKGSGWAGSKTNATVIDGVLKADESGAMWNPNESALMWGFASSPMWRDTTWYAAQYVDQFDTPSGCAGSQLTIFSEVLAESWKIEYRRLGAPRIWSADSELMWSNDSNPMWDIPDYMPWPGSLTAAVDTYQVRVSTSAGMTRGQINELQAIFDVPDILETLGDIAISSSGTRLPITKTYNSIKSCNVTLQAGSTSAYTLEVLDKDATLGPLVQVYDASRTPVSGVVDAVIQGY